MLLTPSSYRTFKAEVEKVVAGAEGGAGAGKKVAGARARVARDPRLRDGSGERTRSIPRVLEES